MAELSPNLSMSGYPGRPVSTQRPEAIKWFRVYAAAMALLYALVVVLAVGLFVFLGSLAEELDAVELFILGPLMGGLSLIFLVAYAVALFLPPSPWVWVYDLVLIAIGLTSCLTMIAAIPLLIYWIKPETKSYFGRV